MMENKGIVLPLRPKSRRPESLGRTGATFDQLARSDRAGDCTTVAQIAVAPMDAPESNELLQINSVLPQK
jgi:hypothetical protein